MNNNDFHVGLVMGGTSAEREVSQLSAKSILKALRDRNYKVKLIDPAYGEEQPRNEDDFFKDSNHEKLSTQNYIKTVDKGIYDEVDVAFIALHGTWGEDGRIQSLFDLRGIKYTGAGVLPSALAMDKSTSKVMFQHYDVQTARWFLLDKHNVDYELVKEKIKKFFGYPCVIKPNDQGSTFGLTVCRGDVEVHSAINNAFKYSNRVIVEEYIEGHEVTVGVLNQKALSVLEIKPKHKIYDYECKYTHGMSDYEVPANFPKETLEHLKHQALLAYNSVGCENYGRVDFKLSKDLQSYCLEVNTLPGMTSTSLLPKMAKATGIEFDDLVDRIVKLALEK
jgi:D-alanine-D-alanine ligase